MADSYAPADVKPAKKMTKAEQGTFITELREKLDASYNFERENRREAAMDMAFVAGYQWPESIRKERQAAGRPILTINRLPQFIRQVTNDIRQADLAIKVAPVDDDGDPKLAKIYNGLIRQIHYQSSGKHVFGTACEHQVSCGIGWFRICTEYTDDQAFDQEIRFKSIRNPLSVYCDPAAIEPDRSDAKWMFVTELIPMAEFKAKYPDASTDGIDPPTDGTGDRLTWLTRDGVRVAEYWVRKPVKKTLGLLRTGETIELDKIGKNLWPMLGVTKTRIADSYEVEQYLVSGNTVLDGPNSFPSKYIPIVPVIGAETPLETAIVRHGLIRFARDPQQLYNYNRTAAAETLALQPKSPYLVSVKMISKFKAIWDNIHKTNYPYLPYESDPDAPGGAPQRQQPPQMSQAFVKEAEMADLDMKATTGIYDSSLGQRSNETSGVAIRNREQQGDTANYHYGDNLQRSLWHAGRILIDIIPKVYDNERVIRCLGEDDSEEHHRINQVVMGVDGLPVTINDLSAGRFDVRATIGASYSTKRMEAADTLLEYLKTDPQAVPMVRDLVAKNFDWPGADEMAKRFKNSIPPNLLVDPEDPNAPPPPPPPNPLGDPVLRSEVVLRAAQAEKNYADAAKIRSETAMAEAGMVPGMTAPQPLPPPEQVLMPPPAPPQGPPPGQEMMPQPEPDMGQMVGPSGVDAEGLGMSPPVAQPTPF
jgi:hypothetical protein